MLAPVRPSPRGALNLNLATPFHREALAHPERLALHVQGQDYSYGACAGWASRVAGALGPRKRVGILASRSLGAYLGVLGAAWCGAAYIPLNPKWPEERLD